VIAILEHVEHPAAHLFGDAVDMAGPKHQIGGARGVRACGEGNAGHEQPDHRIRNPVVETSQGLRP
jgi:hypothetical protein